MNKWGTAGTQHSAGPDIFVWVYSAVADPATAPAANRFKRQHSIGTALGAKTYDLLSELPWVHLGILGRFLQELKESQAERIWSQMLHIRERRL